MASYLHFAEPNVLLWSPKQMGVSQVSSFVVEVCSQSEAQVYVAFSC
jgi:hypothetical protein